MRVFMLALPVVGGGTRWVQAATIIMSSLYTRLMLEARGTPLVLVVVRVSSRASDSVGLVVEGHSNVVYMLGATVEVDMVLGLGGERLCTH